MTIGKMNRKNASGTRAIEKVGDHCSTPKPPVFIAGMLAYLIPASSRLAVYDLTPQSNDSNGIFNPRREGNS